MSEVQMRVRTDVKAAAKYDAFEELINEWLGWKLDRYVPSTVGRVI